LSFGQFLLILKLENCFLIFMAREFTPSAANRAAYDKLKETPVEGTVPPQAVELEEAVLGALMLERDSIIAVQEYITSDTFYTEEHRLIYKAIESLSAELKPIDLYTVTERLKVRKELKKVGGAAYLAQLTQKVGSAANVEFHAKIIAQKYVQRELIRSATEIQRRSYDEDQDVTDLIGFAEGEIFKVAEGHVKRSVQNAKDILAKALAQIEEASKNSSAFNGVQSGFMALDRVTMGWQPSDLIIIAARPSMGKTAFVLSMARNMAVEYQQPVAFFSLEMSAVQLMMRLIVAETGLYSNDIKSGKLTPEQWRHLESATKPLGTAPLFIDDTPALSVFEFRSKARRLKIHNDIKIIVIDYLQLMTGSQDTKGNGNREQEVAFISRTLKAIAKELNVPMIALSQLSRATEQRGGSKRPQLSDLRESGAIEQDADIVAFIHRPEYYGMNTDENGMPTAGLAEIILAKHRNGAVCDVKLRFLKDQARFADMEADINSTAADPMGGGGAPAYDYGSMGGGSVGDIVDAAPAGGALAGGLGSAMGGEFDINPAPTNLDKQAPLNDEVPF
jgi:replicative DNA helicase